MKRRGFTLLEVIVATAIFAMMAAVIAGAYINILRAYQTAADPGLREIRLRFARAQFLATADREKAAEGLEYSDGDSRVRWTTAIEPTEVPDVYRCVWTCTQSAPGGAKDDRVEEVFWLVRQSWARPEERGPIELKLKEAIMKRLPEGTVLGGKR